MSHSYSIADSYGRNLYRGSSGHSYSGFDGFCYLIEMDVTWHYFTFC